ncbi:HK97-gp10 family putative phage morphogenesis protein [Rhodoligotrophos defluvii]|uniref:HK97-gp10 family putative phage morphogenesis protein n=1 Tax=Rhodoligotrophos defluvii TaxID=2561934 RepID=UPI0010C9B640|nr:HK97-gp10 family putative phage morphogenesis protein [Rhodoligotrophos defluvii]
MTKSSFTFKLEGAKELDRALAELPKAYAKSALRDMLKKAAKPVADAARARAPEGPNRKLRGSIRVSTRLKESQRRGRVKRGAVEIFIGATYPPGNNAHLVEFGTGPRYHKNGKYVGQMPPKPFMRPAWDASKDQALAILREEAWMALYRAARRLAKRAVSGKLGKSARRHLGG